MLFQLSSRILFNFFILFYGVLLGLNTQVPVISQLNKKAPVRKHSMSKLAHNRKILYFQTAVLAEPSDHKSGRLGQNSQNFFLYKTGPELTGPEITRPEMTGPELTGPELTGPEMTSPELTITKMTMTIKRPFKCTGPTKYDQVPTLDISLHKNRTHDWCIY